MPRRRRTRSASPHGDCGGSPNEPRPQQRNAANARERARMRVLSKAFCRLKTTLPWVPADTKLSKLDTLRLATSYIAHLRAILTDEEVQPGIHPLNLTWPFSFQQPTQHQHQSQRVGSSAEWSGSSDTNLQPHLKDSSSSCDLEEDHHGFHRHQNNIHYSDSFLHVP